MTRTLKTRLEERVKPVRKVPLLGCEKFALVDPNGNVVDGPTITGASGNDHIPSTQFVDNSMVFVLGGLPSGFSLSALNDVAFQYGTTLAPSEPMLVALQVPEPSVLGLLALGLIAFFKRPQG